MSPTTDAIWLADPGGDADFRLWRDDAWTDDVLIDGVMVDDADADVLAGLGWRVMTLGAALARENGR